MNTDLSFIRDILNHQIASYDLATQAGVMDKEEAAFRTAALQEFKTTLINFIAEANKLTKEQND